MQTRTALKGITWNHTRGYVPMVATAQRFSETHPGVEISWEKRSLQEFADSPLGALADEYDLLVIDHPFVGQCASESVLLPLDEYLTEEYLSYQETQSVGNSHASYAYGDHQWGLAIDTAAPVSLYRPDLMEKHGLRCPRTWDELLDLARRHGVIMPAIPIDALCHFYMLCCAMGEPPFSKAGRVVEEKVGTDSLLALRELVDLCPPVCLQLNPIQVCETLAATDAYAYCPFAYGYSNYARRGYAQHILKFGGLVRFRGAPLRSTLGGAGIAISSRSRNVEMAVKYAMYVADRTCQGGLYFTSGGQPALRSVWLDSTVNGACNDFFRDTLETVDQAYLRPRDPGYMQFQEAAGLIVHEYLRKNGNPGDVLQQLQSVYTESL